MWNVLIADDEPKIRRRLSALVRELGDEYRICAEVGDGEEALERIRDELPDILLVDIRMPRLNGLDLIERIRAETENSIIIVVSGHDEFEYAQRAVQLPVFEYVLKPVAREVLHEVVLRATELLVSLRETNDWLQWARQEVRRNRAGLIQELFNDWVHGFATPTEIEERKRVLTIDDTAYSSLLVIQFNSHFYGGTARDLEEHRVRKIAVKRLADELLSAEGPPISFEDRNERFVFLLGATPSSSRAERVQREIRSRLNSPVYVATGRCRLDYESFLDDYESVCESIEGNQRSSVFVRRLTALLDERFADRELNLESAARELALSPDYMSRLVKQYTGYSFSEYTNRYRVCKAIPMLADDRKMIYEIAEVVGYSSQHYFSRMFKRITGRPPADFRRGRDEER